MTETSPPVATTPLVDRHVAPRRPADRVRRLADAGPVQLASSRSIARSASGSGLFDLSHMGELFVEGPEAGEALAAALVTDPPALAVGRAHYSMICAPDGGIIDDLIVYRLAEERFLVVANAGNAAVVSDALAERLGGHARRPRRPVARDRPGRHPGPASRRGPRAADRRRPRRACATTRSPRARSPGIPALVARTGYTGEDGFEVFVDDRRGPASCGTRCCAAGAPPRPAGRPGRARHAAARGRHAALRQRAGPRPRPRSRRASAGSSSSTSPATSSAGRRWRRSPRTGPRRSSSA